MDDEVQTFFTTWNDYKVGVYIAPYSHDHGRTINLGVEFRPEYGMGYAARGFGTIAFSATFSSCPCEKWQWNGQVNEKTVDDTEEFASTGSGQFVDGLRQGLFRMEYQQKLPGDAVAEEGTVDIVYTDGTAPSGIGDDTLSVSGMTQSWYCKIEEPWSQEILDMLYW